MFKFARGVQKLICQNFYNYILAQSRRLGAPCNLIFKLISCFFHRKCVFIWFLFSRYRVQFSPKNWLFFGFRICNHLLTTIFSIYRVKIERGAVVTPPLWCWVMKVSFNLIFLSIFLLEFKKNQNLDKPQNWQTIIWIILMRIEFEKTFFSGKFEKNFFLKIVKTFLVDFRRGGAIIEGWGNYCVNSGIYCLLQNETIAKTLTNLKSMKTTWKQ